MRTNETNEAPNYVPDLLIGGAILVGVATGMVVVAPGVYVLVMGLVATLMVFGGMMTVAGSLFSTGNFIDGLIAWQIMEGAFRIAFALLQVTVAAAGGNTSSD